MATQPGDRQLRKSGIGVVGDVPWGTHFCMFYETKEDLLDMLVPYFKAGLENREVCLWVVSEPLSEGEAKNAMREAVSEFDSYLADFSIEIRRSRQFYLTGQELDLDRVFQTWIEKTDSALDRGYAGFRLSASTAWLQRKNWKAFCDYENEVNNSIGRWRMTALCSYPLARSTATQIFDVTGSHQFAIARRNGSWEVLETSELKQAKSEIKRLNDELEQRVIERTRQLAAVNEGMRKETIERQHAEEALQQARAELDHVTRALAMGEMVASIAHEVNQPLTGVVTNGNFALRELVNGTPNLEKLREAVAEIVEDGTRASAVISRIRALLKKGTSHRIELDINKVIDETAILVRNEAKRNRVALRLTLAADLPLVLGDRVQLQQVLINLAMNGIDAMATLTNRPRELIITSAKYSDGVLVKVQDSGIGIDPSKADRIFEPFFTTKPLGIGMGLSISRSIIESHSGRLWTVPLTQGALFQFTLPANGISLS